MDYAVRDFSGVRGLRGLPDGLVEAHLKLYAGYVLNTNVLRSRRAESKPGTPEWAEMTRRLGFEVNGMRLHELYFEALAAGGGDPGGAARGMLVRGWGSVDRWRAEFAETGRLRGIGWVITYLDPVAGDASNYWVGAHEQGHPAGFVPLVVMDVWEHAYTGMERPAYIEAYLSNLDWSVVERRVSARVAGAGAGGPPEPPRRTPSAAPGGSA